MRKNNNIKLLYVFACVCVCAHLALEAVAMPFGIERNDRILRYGLAAAGAASREQLLEVDTAIGTPVPLVEGGAHQWLLAGASADKAFLVPRLLHGLDGALQQKEGETPKCIFVRTQIPTYVHRCTHACIHAHILICLPSIHLL